MTKGQVLSYSLILTHTQMMTLATFFLFLPNLGSGNKGYLFCWLPSPNLFVQGGLGEWLLGPPLSSILANVQAGMGDKG